MKIWRHKKTGGLYVVVTDNFQIEATMEQGILYKGVYDGKEWVRPKTEFMDGRFEPLNHSKDR